MVEEHWTLVAASKPAKPKKPRAPEEVWRDVHKHPEGVPGGMGKSPEHHLRGRGWNGHEINEGSGKKTIQYRNHKYPDFVVSYGGGTSQKPDHNFRVLYMGVNHNVPRVTRAYSVAEAMNKVEELHQLQSGLIVQPMTYGASGPLGYGHAVEGASGLICPNCGGNNLYTRNFRVRQEDPDLGCNDCREKLHSPEKHEVVSDRGWEYGDDAMTHGAALVPSERPDNDGLKFFKDNDLLPPDNTNTDQPMFDIKNDIAYPKATTDYSPGDNCETCYLKNGDPESGPETHIDSGNEDYSVVHPFKPFTREVGSRFSAAAPATPPSRRDMTKDDPHPIGPPKTDDLFPTQPDRELDWPKKQTPQVQEIKTPPKPKPAPAFKPAPVSTMKTQKKIKYGAGPPRTQNDHGTLAGRIRDRAAGGQACPLCHKAAQIYRKDPELYRDLIQDSGGLTDDHLRTISPFHDRVNQALIPLRGYSAPRHPEGLGPADLGRAEYQRRRNADLAARRDADTVQVAAWHGMHIEPEEVSRYPGLKKVISALDRAGLDSWEEPPQQDYYHGTTKEDLDEISPATSHRRGVIFPSQTDPEYAYATPSERNAWHYAELAWHATDSGIPRVYRVRPTGPVEEDPTHWPNGESRGNFSGDVRSRHPFEVHEELPTPEYWQRDDDEEDW